MKTKINGFTLERKESYCGRTTPIVEWIVYWPNGALWATYQRKKDAIEFINSTQGA
jgi:hypothetical protein